MRIMLISPNNEVLNITWEQLYSVSKDICLKYIEQSDENKRKFENFAKHYKYFEPYYDFMIHRMRFIQVGTPFLENSFIFPSLNIKKVYQFDPNKELSYKSLTNQRVNQVMEIFCGDDKTLDRIENPTDYTEGLLLPDGSLISIKNIINHRDLSYTYLLQKFVVSPEYLSDYLKHLSNLSDIREFIYYRTGIAMLASKDPKTAIYDKNLVTEKQLKTLMSFRLDPYFQKLIDEDFSNPYSYESLENLNSKSQK